MVLTVGAPIVGARGYVAAAWIVLMAPWVCPATNSDPEGKRVAVSARSDLFPDPMGVMITPWPDATVHIAVPMRAIAVNRPT